MADRCPTDVYYEFHGMGTDKLQLRPCALLGWAYCNGYCNSCQATITTHTPYDPIEIARQYAPKSDKPVVDMVEVVRCKDCKYSVFEQWVDALDIYTCDRTPLTRACGDCSPTDFCSWGERKDDAEK